MLLSLTACRTPSPAAGDGTLSLTPVTVAPPAESDTARAMAWFGVGLYRDMHKDYTGALQAFLNAIEEAPEDEALYMMTTGRLVRAKRKEDAFDLLNDLLAQDPDNLQALRLKARLYHETGDPQNALATYQLALGQSPAEQLVYLEAIQASIHAQQPQLGLEFARQGVEFAAQTDQLTVILLRLLEAAEQGAVDLVTLSELKEEQTRILQQARQRYPENSRFYYLQAEQDLLENQFGQAFATYQELDALTGGTDEERARILVHAIEQLGGGRQGAQDFRDALADLPNSSLAFYLDGLLWELQGSEDKALTAYEQATELDTEDLSSLQKRVVLYYQSGQSRKSAALLEEALAKNPQDPELLLLSGQIALSLQNYRLAATQLQQRIRMINQGVPTDNVPVLHAQLAIALWETGASIRTIENQLETSASVPGNLEMVYRHRFQSIARIRETHPAQADREEEALFELLDNLNDRLPRNPEITWLVASAYSYRNEYAQTLEYLEEMKLRAEDTDNPDVWLGPEYWFDVAAAQERTGLYHEAVATFETIINDHPEHHPSLNYVAYMWAEQGENLGQALAYSQRAIRLSPDSGSYIDTLGWVFYQLGEFEKAYPQLLRSAELIPDESVVAEHLGDVLMKLDRPVEARGYYRIALALDPADRQDVVVDSLQAAEQAVSDALSARD